MIGITNLLKRHCSIVTLTGIVLILTTIPVLNIHFVLGDKWQGIPPTFTDETFYFGKVQAVVEGHAGGHPYFLEHRDDPPLVLFGGALIGAIPQLMGLPLNAALMVNFILWSLVFAVVLYWLFRELRIHSWVAVCSVVVLYLQSYSHIWRPVNLQPVYPLYFLFYLALLRLIRDQNRFNIILLGLVTGATFYLLAYLWQIAIITLGLLFLYALIRKNWKLLRSTILASLLGGSIGFPVLLHLLWLSHTSPFFWESLHRLGLVNTHLPMAEVIYSGGWIGIALLLLGVLFWRVQALRKDRELVLISVFLVISGLGLWIMQGSNLITGKLFETGEHVRTLIQPWLIFATVSIGTCLWRRRAQVSKMLQLFALCILAALSIVSLQFAYQRLLYFIPAYVDRELWETQQLYAKPFAWLEDREKTSVVVWNEPHDYIAINLPVFTKHFTLYAQFGMSELVSEDEIRERYLVSQYFNNPTADSLAQHADMTLYLGRRDLPHQAKTIERGIKLCRIIFFWNKTKECGTPPTPQELLGEQFFLDLAYKFKTDVKPNIKAYLKKYHVAYILKDKILNPQYHPEYLGAIRVYNDERFEMYHLP